MSPIEFKIIARGLQNTVKYIKNISDYTLILAATTILGDLGQLLRVMEFFVSPSHTFLHTCTNLVLTLITSGLCVIMAQSVSSKHIS